MQAVENSPYDALVDRPSSHGGASARAVVADRTPHVGVLHTGRRLLGVAGGPLAVVEAAAFLAAAPLLVFPNRYSAAALVVLPLAWLARLIARRRMLRRTPADWPLAGLLLMASISLYPSIDLALSRPKLYGLVLGLYLCTLLSEHVRPPLGRYALAAVLVVGGAAVALAGLVGTSWIVGKWPLVDAIYPRLPRLVTEVRTSAGALEGGFHPAEVGGTLALLLPCALGLLLFSRGWAVRLALGAASVVMLGTLALTVSRSALGGIMVALVVLAVLRWPRLALALPVVAVGLVATVWALGPQQVADSLLTVEMAATLGTRGRLEIWSRALWLIEDFPLTGAGLNTFPVLIPLLYPSTLLGAGTRIPHAHNLFLQVGVDFGLLGLASFLGLLAAAWLSLARAWRTASGWERGLVAGLVAGLLAHLVFGLTDAVALGAKPGVLLWAVLGGALALGIGTPSAAEDSSARQSRRSAAPPDLPCPRAENGAGGEVGESAGLCGEVVGAESASDACAAAASTGAEAAPPSLRQAGAGALQWTQWALFALACGLGVLIAVTGVGMVTW